MNLLKRLGGVVWTGSLLFLTACLLNNTIPELEKPDDPPDPAAVIINITEPIQDEVLPWLDPQNIRVNVTGIDYHPADFQVFINDSLFMENQIPYGSTFNFRQITNPFRWAQPNSPFVVKALLTDALEPTGKEGTHGGYRSHNARLVLDY